MESMWDHPTSTIHNIIFHKEHHYFITIPERE